MLRERLRRRPEKKTWRSSILQGHMYEIYSQQRKRTKLENKLIQQMLQHSRYTEKRNDKMRKEKMERDKVVHGLVERDNIHNRVWDRDSNSLGRFRHERWEVGGGWQIHSLLNCVVILDTVQSCLNLKKMMMKRHSIEWQWILTNGRKKARLNSREVIKIYDRKKEYGARTMHFHSELLHRTSSLLLSHYIKDPVKQWSWQGDH